ncbi:unnamed protein product [Closterium sp. NIES-53]
MLYMLMLLVLRSAAALGASASAATGASESAASESAASAEALHTFTLDSGVSRCFFCDCTTVTPLAAPVPVSLTDPSEGPVVARASTVLPCPAVPSGSLLDLHLPSFSTNLVSNAVLQDPGSSLYTLATVSAQMAASGPVAASSQVFGSGQLAASCSCRVLSHQTLLSHHQLGHPSLPRLCSMHSHLLVSGLPRSLPPLPRSLTPPCLPCVEGRQRATPHSSSFPPTTAPLQALHMDVWGPTLVRGTDQELYFLLVVDDYTRYTMVFPFRGKADRFRRDLPVLRLHSDRGNEFSSGLHADFCRDEGIAQSFMLLASLQQNGIAERRIGLIMEVARTSMIHAVAPHFLWPFAVRYAAHQLNLWPRGALSLVRDTTASKLSPCTLRCVFLGFPVDASPWQFYHSASHRVLSSQDVTFDESVCFYRLHPHASHPFPLPPLNVVPIPNPVDPLPPQGPAPSGVSQEDPPPLVEPLEVSSDTYGLGEVGDPAANDTSATRHSPRLETPPGFPPRPSSPLPQPVDVEFGAARCGDTGGEDSRGAGPGGAKTGGEGFGGAYSWGAASPSGGEDVGAPAAGPGIGQQQKPSRPKSLSSVLDRSSLRIATFSVSRQLPLISLSLVTKSLTGRREPESRASTPVRACCVAHSHPPALPGTHLMALRASSIPLCVVLPSPCASSLPHVADPESDLVRAASPTVTRFLATCVTYPSFSSPAATALVAELVDFAAMCRLDYAARLVFDSDYPPSVGGESALGCDVLEDRQFELEHLAAAAPHLAAMLLCPEGDPDALDMPTPCTYIEAISCTYVDEVLRPGANIVDGMWIFRVKRPPGSPPAFKACYVAQGLSQQQGVDFFQNFSPTPKMTSLQVLLHIAAQHDYELHSLDFSTTFL